MTRLLRVELLKLRTTRLSYGLLATGAGLTALFTILVAAFAGPGQAAKPLSTFAGLNAVLTGGVWTLLMALVLGVTVTSGEFRHSTATGTYLATPGRGRVSAAKAAAAACGGAAFGLAGSLIATAVGLGFVAARGYHLAIPAATILRYMAGAVLAGALLAAAGAGVGSLLRSQLAAVIGVFAWAIVIESLLGGLLTSARPYLPYTAATTLAGASPGAAAFGPAHDVTGSGPLPFAAAAALLLGVAAALSAIASRTTVRRDVT